MARILLAGKDWTARALLRAQLIEEGFDIEAFEDVQAGIKRLWASKAMPTLLIADVYQSENSAEDISLLSQWAELVPIWIMAGHDVVGAEALEGQGFEKVLFRPVDMKELVQQIKVRLAN